MLLVVDVGNTQTHFGAFRGTELIEHWRFATVRESTADELGAKLRALLELRGLHAEEMSASIVSSASPVSPELSCGAAWRVPSMPMPRKASRAIATAASTGCEEQSVPSTRTAPAAATTT